MSTYKYKPFASHTFTIRCRGDKYEVLRADGWPHTYRDGHNCVQPRVFRTKRGAENFCLKLAASGNPILWR